MTSKSNISDNHVSYFRCSLLTFYLVNWLTVEWNIYWTLHTQPNCWEITKCKPFSEIFYNLFSEYFIVQRPLSLPNNSQTKYVEPLKRSLTKPSFSITRGDAFSIIGSFYSKLSKILRRNSFSYHFIRIFY